MESVIKNGKLFTIYEEEKREWIPEKSKLAAAIMNGLSDIHIKPGSIILYLGAASGTTISHISDIIGSKGIIYAVEFSEKPFHALLNLAEKRKNIAPILADARLIQEYGWVEECDCIYVDLADPQEIEISILASEFLKNNGYVIIAIKSQSIDVLKNPQQVYKESIQKLNATGFKVLQQINLEPYEEKHAMIIAQKSVST